MLYWSVQKHKLLRANRLKEVFEKYHMNFSFPQLLLCIQHHCILFHDICATKFKLLKEMHGNGLFAFRHRRHEKHLIKRI